MPVRFGDVMTPTLTWERNLEAVGNVKEIISVTATGDSGDPYYCNKILCVSLFK